MLYIQVVTKKEPEKQRSEMVQVRLTPAEKRRFQAGAAEMGTDLSNWLRMAAYKCSTPLLEE